MYTYDKVITAQPADGSTSSLNWDGRTGQVAASGTWDSATIQLEFSPDDGTTWISVGDEGKLSADGLFNFDLNPCNIRLTVASAGSSTSLNAWVTSEEYGSSKV